MRLLAAASASLLAAATAAAQSPHAAHQPAAHGTAAATAVSAPGVQVVTVTARDYAFDLPDTIPAGLTAFRLVNRGSELHHLQLLRLEDGKTMGDLHATMGQSGPPPAWVRDIGGPNAPAPNGENSATVDLTPGRYVLACFIPSADGIPHVAKGMVRELMVTGSLRPARASRSATSTTQTTLTLSDYEFGFSRPLTVGTQTVRVRNAATQPHEIFIVRLEPGKTAADVAAWVEKMDGPPPGVPAGGVTGIASGEWNDMTLTIEPGDYALLCFIPDAKDGKPHVAHSMIKQITVAGGGTASGSSGSR